MQNYDISLSLWQWHLSFSTTVGEGSGSVVELLTRDRRAVGSSLTSITLLWSLSKTHLSLFSTGSTWEDLSLFKWKIVDGT